MPASHSALPHACLECKRLKLKCDKQQPCSSCIRRGCPDICPDGQLVAGKGTRFILSNTKELHDEIGSLRSRVKELESALESLQTQLTPQPHALLQESLKVVAETLQPVEKDIKSEPPEDENLIDTFGSLTIDHRGQTTWHGPHAGSEFFIPRNGIYSMPPAAPSQLPLDLLLLSKHFPYKTVYEAENIVRQQLRARLPPKQVAYDSALLYHTRLAWTAAPGVWEEFVEYVLKPAYEGDPSENDEPVAVLFIVLAISMLLDPTLPAFHPEAIQYYHLSRISINLGEDLFQSKSLLAIQYLQLLSFYNGVSNEPNGPDKAWVATSMAIRLAQMAGLHRDNKQWDAYPEQAERRRRIWWDLVLFETVSGFALGRPRAITAKHFDTKLPHDDEDEGKAPSFNRTKYRWVADGIGAILDEAFGVRAPSYNVTLNLDKKMRDWPLESIPSVDDICHNRPLDINERFMILLMRSFATTGLREIALLYLHRRYFIEALVRRPSEPLRSKYAMSVLAVHRSAVLVLQGIQRLDGLIGKLLPRIFFMWLHGLSAYVCLCAIVIKSPGCSLSRSCLVEIDSTKDLFARVTAYRVSHAQPAIAKLYEQAHLSMALYREGKWPPQTQTPGEMASVDPDIDVMRFAGRPGFVSAPDPPETTTNTPEYSAAGSSPGQAHPLLFEYLKKFQSDSEGEGQGPACATFPPEQSMMPAIMPGSDAFVEYNESCMGHVSPTSHVNGNVSLMDSCNPRGSGPYAMADWATMLSSYETPSEVFLAGNQAIHTDHIPSSASSETQYSMDTTGFPQQPGAEAEYVWDQFLSGLIPQGA